jgi:hypothetical protein
MSRSAQAPGWGWGGTVDGLNSDILDTAPLPGLEPPRQQWGLHLEQGRQHPSLLRGLHGCGWCDHRHSCWRCRGDKDDSASCNSDTVSRKHPGSEVMLPALPHTKCRRRVFRPDPNGCLAQVHGQQPILVALDPRVWEAAFGRASIGMTTVTSDKRHYKNKRLSFNQEFPIPCFFITFRQLVASRLFFLHEAMLRKNPLLFSSLLIENLSFEFCHNFKYNNINKLPGVTGTTLHCYQIEKGVVRNPMI